MRLMGIDYGDRRIGIAVSDELMLTAQGVATIENNGDESVFRSIGELAREYEVERFVVGLPRNMNGSIGPRGELAQSFAKRLGEATGLPVAMWDERLTTMFAQRTLLEADVSRKKRKAVVDKMAAALLLQNYMEAQNSIKR